MESPVENALFDRLIAPWALFLGATAAFLGCCLGGYLASGRNHVEHFERFHAYLTPESLFYPTACQVYQLAKSRLDPDKIAVIIGGTSALQGTCQTLDQVWTRKLQALLGERYQVLNFGFRNGQTQEIGATAAEILARDYRKLILIADLHPGWIHPGPDGFMNRYFFWDAYYKGLLLSDEARAERLRVSVHEGESERKNVSPMRKTRADEQLELRAEMSLDSLLYFNDLWNTLAYTRFHTVWTRLTAGSFTRARRYYADDDPGAQPLETRYLRNHDDCMLQVRRLLEVENNPAVNWANFEKAACDSFPEPVRRRTLLLALWYSPHYLEQLSPREQVRHERVSRLTVAHLEKSGFPALAVGQGFSASDYADVMHLTESGGAKLAAAVAPKVRALAERLGYAK